MNQSVLKAMSILNLFIQEKELSLQEISQQTKIPKPTAYRLLSTLEACGMVYNIKETPHDSRYGLGLKLLEFGHLVSERLELREVALPYMETLAEEINEVVHLVIVHQNEAAYIEKVNSTRALSLQTKIGRSTPLYVGSGPKLLLAFLTEEEQQKILSSQNLYTFNGDRIDENELKKELETIRKQFYAFSVSEQDPDTTGISFPIFNYENNVVAALAISGLSTRFTGDRLEKVKSKGKKAANAISIQLGYK